MLFTRHLDNGLIALATLAFRLLKIIENPQKPVVISVG